MPISSVGKRNSAFGVTLIEMMMVVTIIALVVGISFPAISAGIENIRLSSATESVASFLNGAMNRAERRQVVVQISVSQKENTITMRSTEPGFLRKLELPAGVSIEAVLPKLPEEIEGPRRFLLLPGGTPPRIGIQLASRRGAHRVVSVDPITGVPRIEVVEAQ